MEKKIKEKKLTRVPLKRNLKEPKLTKLPTKKDLRAMDFSPEKPRNKAITKEELLKAIKIGDGSAKATSEALGVAPHQFYRVLARHEEAKKEYDILRRMQSDVISSLVMEGIQKGIADPEATLNDCYRYANMLFQACPAEFAEKMRGLDGTEEASILTEEQHTALYNDVVRIANEANIVLKADKEFPVDFRAVAQLRVYIKAKCVKDKNYVKAVWKYYSKHPIDFISHWCNTHDPRKSELKEEVDLIGEEEGIPFVLFKRQRELVQFLDDMRVHKMTGLIEKSRDVGATWTCSAYSLWCWVFIPSADIGWGSRKQDLVDKKGNRGSIFEKIRDLIRGLPDFFKPEGLNEDEDLKLGTLRNRANKSTMMGEYGTDMGRGNRFTMFFKDESAHYDQPDKIDAAISATTQTVIDLSSVNGTDNPFYTRRMAGLDYDASKKFDPTKTTKARANVFVMEWNCNTHDLTKTQQWYDETKAGMEMSGQGAIFAQEYDRDYSASIADIIIRPEWIEAATDAHKKLGIKENGVWLGGFDIAASGADTNALVIRRGIMVCGAEEWGKNMSSTMNAITLMREYSNEYTIQFDPIGVGEVVNVEEARLRGDGVLRDSEVFIAWHAGATPLNPEEKIDDSSDLRIVDVLDNLKAQGWQELAKRFRKTYMMVRGEGVFEADELISIPSDLPLYNKLITELGQPTFTKSISYKTTVRKTKKGGKSPNLADALMMAFHPVEAKIPGFLESEIDVFN